MGQSSSRFRESSRAELAAPLPQSVVNDSNDGSTVTHTEGLNSQGPNERRRKSRVGRRSILNLVKPRPTTTRQQGDSRVSNSSSNRKSWLHSRRWSKAPQVDLGQNIDEGPSDSTSLALTANPINHDYEEGRISISAHEAPETFEARPITAELSPNPNLDSPQEDSQPTLSLQSSSATPMEDTNELRGSEAAVTDPGTSDSSFDGRTDTPSLEPTNPNMTSPHAPEASQGATPPPQLPNRQFPPPGTLVVVQGVVHTTDVPRPPPTTLEDSTSTVLEPQDETRRARALSTPAGTRNRLSTLLHGSRPSSRASNRPSSSSEDDGTNSLPVEVSDSDSPSSNDSSTPSGSTPESEATTTTTTAATSPSQASSISSSSIDVLGTLLSVAAAATAASLLTGSSEPILSSGLSQPNAAAATPSPPPPPPRSSLFEPSPFLTAMPTPSVPPIAGLGLPDSTFGRAERMRQAWASVRDRLGLRSSPNSTNVTTATGGDIVPGADGADGARVPVDARERMLTEMARAFNLGLGFDTEGSSPNSNSGDAAENAESLRAESEPPLPPEGSFERFLVDLQADLRVALMGNASEGQSQANQHTNERSDGEAAAGGQPELPSMQQAEQTESVLAMAAEPESERFVQGVTERREGTSEVEADVLGSMSARQPHTVTVDDAPCHPRAVASSNSEVSHSHPHSEVATLPDTVVQDDDDEDDSHSYDSLPPLQDVSDSDSDPESDSDSESESVDGLHFSAGEDEANRRRSTDSDASSGLSHILRDLSSRRSTTFNTTPSNAQSSPASNESWADALPPSRLRPSRAAESFSPLPSNPPAPRSDRINWWRLYRFPPITAPRAQAAVDNANMRSQLARSSPGTSTASPLQNSSNIISPSSPSLMSDSQTSTTFPASSPSMSTDPTYPRTDVNSSSPAPESPPNANVVVPVIVVGLQSVNMMWANEPATIRDSLDNPTMEPDATDGRAYTPTSDNMPSLGAQGPGAVRPESPRERRWQSRAANALRNLRPGARRQHVPRGFGLPDLDGPGSRTFLIYVIGGKSCYYPADHSIVTDEPDNFDSFEALLDLAELLGQVRPPTVSKEDIQKSGLEVIKASQLAEHERSGKISSNCTERCLICLDDYEPENDVRVLSCKHGFHMSCVDKWLSEGRNNCPACRSKGVSDDDFASPMPPTGYAH